jgi:hypothetical protein
LGVADGAESWVVETSWGGAVVLVVMATAVVAVLYFLQHK